MRTDAVKLAEEFRLRGENTSRNHLDLLKDSGEYLYRALVDQQLAVSVSDAYLLKKFEGMKR